jgi:hypothetical protein
MPNSTFTSPKAYITIDGQTAGFVRNISFTENIQRQDIRGLGNLYPVESPAVSASNTFNVDMFFIDFSQPVVKKLINRYGGVDQLMNTLALGDIPISINIYKRTIAGIDSTTKLVTEVNRSGQEIAVLRNCFVDSQNWSLAEGGIAAMTTSGRYLSPVTFNP